MKAYCSLPTKTMIQDHNEGVVLSLFNFGHPAKEPESFKPTCHLFYGSRVIEIQDDLPKWSGYKNHSQRL
nr:hypothetical protein [uncultured Desulfobacter sp.]